MSNKVEGIWIGEKDLGHDDQFLLDSQNEMRSPSLVDAMGDQEVADNVGGNRRDFLKIMGFGLGAATVAAGCDIPVKRAIPYVIKPDEIVPGVATYYASSFVDGGDYCSILVKTREGRPIKIEGNSLSPVTKGGTSARAQAAVLGLYDTNRIKHPSVDGEAADWESVDKRVKSILSSSRAVRLVTKTILSPTAKKAVAAFAAKYPQTEIVTYDPVSSAAILEANEQSFGDAVIPDYHFDKADLIVSFNADFLGTWISPIEYANAYAKGRKIKDVKHAKMSKHVQVESQMSMTGSNADNRILVKPSEQGAAIAFLYQQISGAGGNTPVNDKAKKALTALAKQLKAANGKALVVSASNNTDEQVLINAINNAIGSYGNTITFDHASLQRQGNEGGLVKLAADAKAGRVDTVIFHNCNPVYEYAGIADIASSLGAIKNKISLGYIANETNALANIVAPVNHSLESWGDAEAKRGQVSLIQPTISPLFDTRQAEVSLLTWAGAAMSDSDQPYFDYLKSNWEATYFGKQSNFLSFQAFWDNALHDGVFNTSGTGGEVSFAANASSALSRISKPGASDIEIQFTESVAIGNGQYSDIPWLQEMPDPVTRCAWGNYLAVPVDFDGVKKFKALNGLKDGDTVELTVSGTTVTVPVVQQFGQMKGTVALHMGYGRTSGSMSALNIGADVNPAIGISNGKAVYSAGDVSVSNSKGEEKHFSSVQYHGTMGVTAPDAKTGETINADETALAPGYGNVAKGYQGSLTERSIIRKAHVDHLAEAIDDLIHEREHHEGLNLVWQRITYL